MKKIHSWIPVLILALVLPFCVSCDKSIYNEFFTDTLTVTFDSQGGSNVKSQKLNYGWLVTEPADPVRIDFTFLGWYTDTAYTDQWDFMSDTVTGDMTLYARWNSGGLDLSFNPGTGAVGGSYPVYSISIQNDGKIIIGGDLTVYDGNPNLKRVARIEANGSFDATFDSTTGVNNLVYTTTIQDDGQIVMGGMFTTYNVTSRNRIARLNTDGTLDTTFAPGTGASSHVRTIAIQDDGQILIGGYFTIYDGTARSHIARLNTDGTLDLTFNPGSGADGEVNCIAIQNDGQILIGGDFTTYNGISRNGFARLNTDGSLDTDFDIGTGVTGNTATVWSIVIQSNGRILIGGSFTTYNGTSRVGIARILP